MSSAPCVCVCVGGGGKRGVSQTLNIKGLLISIRPKGRIMLWPRSSVCLSVPLLVILCVPNSYYSFHEHYLKLATMNFHDV